jgi:hypothetical protein
MKHILALIALIITAGYTQAQTCRIIISYDANGNRIQRALVCPDEHIPPDKAVLYTVRKKMDGLGDLTSGTYQVYPNPAENKVNIKLDANLLAKDCSIFMTELTGKVLYQQRNVSSSVSEIDLQGYADGTYFIVVVQGTDRHTVKIVKQTGGGY